MPEDPPRDSAGTPWAARELTPSGFESDDGSADRALLAALASAPDDADLVRAVRSARLLVPVVAAPTDVDTSGEHPVETGVDMAAVTLVAPDGRRGLPAFSGLDALRAWDPLARPVPVTPARAGQAAVTEGCEVIVLDVAGPATRVLRPSMVWALAQDRDWLPAHEDPFVARAVAAAVAPEDDVAEHGVEAGDAPGVLRVVLRLVPGLAADAVRALATRVGERLAADGELRARVDGIAFTVR
jgi:hypothetical protein